MKRTSLRIVIYPDSRKGFGIGNAMRCSELARLLCRKHEVYAVVAGDIRRKMFRKAGASLIDQNALSTKSFDVLLFDVQGPLNASELFSRFRARNPYGKVIALDYVYHTEEHADIAINLQALWGRPSRGETMRQHFGFKYAIIREKFRSCRKQAKRCKSGNGGILLTFGGEDPRGYSLATLRALVCSVGHEVPVIIIMGQLNRDRKEIVQFARKHENVAVVKPTARMPQLMLGHDIALCGGGTTLMELAYMGVPALALPQQVMEKNFIREFIKAGFVPGGLTNVKKAIEYAVRLLKNTKEITARTRTGQRLIDGRGAERIVAVIEKAGRESVRRQVHGE